MRCHHRSAAPLMGLECLRVFLCRPTGGSWVHRRAARLDHVSVPDDALHRPTVPRTRTRPGSSSLGSSPLQSSFVLAPARTPFETRPEPVTARIRLPGFRPSSRHDSNASTTRGLPGPRSRSVLRRSQPPDGFLRARARGLISSRSRVQGSSRSGGSLPAQPLPPRRRERAPVPLAPQALADRFRRPHPTGLDSEALIHARQRSCGSAVKPDRRPLPSSGSLPSRFSGTRCGPSLPRSVRS